MINKMIRKNLIAEIKEIKSAIKNVYYNCQRQYDYSTGTFPEYEKKMSTLNKTFNEFYLENTNFINQDDKLFKLVNQTEDLLLKANQDRCIKDLSKYYEDGEVFSTGLSQVEVS